MKFKREDGTFDVERFKAAVRIFITAQEILVDNASYPTKEIAENSHIFRTLGLGYANLGSLIMSYGLPYDSRRRPRAGRRHHRHHDRPRLRAVAPKSPRHGRRSRATATPVARTSPSRWPKDNVESMLGVIQQHRDAVEDIQPSQEFNYLKDEARQMLGPRARHAAAQHGYRNAQVTVLAPTGTIAFLMDCDTTGIEPDIALVKYKLLAGGGMLKIVNRTVPEGAAPARLQRRRKSSASSPTSRNSTPSKTSRKTARPSRSGLKPEHLPVFDCAFKPLSRPAQHPLPGAPEDDGRRAAVHQRRHFQDRQHAERKHRRGHPRHLRAGLEDGPQVRGHLPRRLEALAAAQHQEDQRRRRQGAPRRTRPRWKPASRNSKPKSPSCAPRPASRCAAACPTRARPSRTSSTSPATKATSPSACSRTASPANCSSPWPRKARPSAA